MKRVIECIGVIAFACFTSPVMASFHLWVISEVYSNQDGSVQFIELQALSSGQQFLAGHTIVSSSGSGSKSFTFASDLPGDSAGRSFLIGTQGFAALGLIAPDYIAPNGFLATTNGSVNFAGVSRVSWANLPIDALHSIDASGAAASNTPTNFAGMTSSIVPAAGIASIDCLFNWAENTHPDFFAPKGVPSQQSEPYYFRFYSERNAYLAVASNVLYYLGPLSSNTVLNLGSTASWFTSAGCP